MGLSGAIWSYVDAGLKLFYPDNCQICRNERATAKQGYVGEACRRKIQILTVPFCSQCGLPIEGAVTTDFICSNCQDVRFHFVSARGAVRVNDTILDVIHRYKYNQALYLEPFLAELLISQAKPTLGTAWDRIIPVPLHPLKERERQFNQAARLANCLSRATGIPVDRNVVRRILPTISQTRLDREERRANVRGAFAPVPGVNLDGQRVVLIDDILTTCSTTNACAHALKQAGAGQICVWAVARGA